MANEWPDTEENGIKKKSDGGCHTAELLKQFGFGQG